MIALMLCIASLVACGINEAPDFGEGIGEAVALSEEECRYIL